MTITEWRKNRRVTIYPDLELDQRPYTQTEMRDLVEKLKASLPELNIIIYEQSTYCKELNGEWNVCFAVQGHPVGDPNRKISYTYMIRSCDDLKKTYGCPFINSDYFYHNITGLMKSLNEPLFNIIESKLMELVPSAKKVDYFDT
jgi:hypothetical protein